MGDYSPGRTAGHLVFRGSTTSTCSSSEVPQPLDYRAISINLTSEKHRLQMFHYPPNLGNLV